VIVAIDLSRTIFRRIRYNFVWAMGYNCLMIPMAAGAFFPLMRVSLPPMYAGMAMAMSSVSVVTSSLLLNLYKPPQAGRIANKGKGTAVYGTPLEAAVRGSQLESALA
jgi:Cu+-exporting ATPase